MGKNSHGEEGTDPRAGRDAVCPERWETNPDGRTSGRGEVAQPWGTTYPETAALRGAILRDLGE